MPALIVGGFTVPGVVSANRKIVEAVERERSYNNTMLATQIAADKDQWNINVSHINAADLASLEAALATTPPVTCSGDVLGGSVSCHIEKGGSEPVLGILPRRWNFNFVLHEV